MDTGKLQPGSSKHFPFAISGMHTGKGPGDDHVGSRDSSKQGNATCMNVSMHFSSDHNASIWNCIFNELRY